MLFDQNFCKGTKFYLNIGMFGRYFNLIYHLGYPKSSRRASSTLRTGCNCILNLRRSKPCMLYFGSTMSVNPSFSASAMRCSMRFTGRTSPDRPTSPAMHQPLSIGVSTLLDRTAAITERSIAMSVTPSKSGDQ